MPRQVGAYVSMFMCNVYPKKTFYPIWLGSIIEALGVGLLAWALWSEHKPTIFGMIALTGTGTGLRFMPSESRLSFPLPNAQANSHWQPLYMS